MKRRRSTPLLRATVAAAGTAMLACAGPGAATGPDGSDGPDGRPPDQPEPEAADRTLKLVLIPETGVVPKEPATLTLTSLDGRTLATRTLAVDSGAAGAVFVDWAIDPSVELPSEVRVSLVIPMDDDPKNPSPNDLSAVVTGKVGEKMNLVPRVHMPSRDVTVVAVPSAAGRERQARLPPPGPPVYANTKGSHHFQDAVPVMPAPVVVAVLEVEGPEDRDLHGMNLRVVGPDPLDDELHGLVAVTRFPSEVRVMALPGQVVPERFQVILEAGKNLGKRHVAEVDAFVGGRVRAVLRAE